ncbi:unnamed protein product [Trichobilharzia szidati]|nr:unnamed protein product [Trichobilharzia szidati]
MGISLVGDPSLVIMDEPSCGVDPRSRRSLWSTLLKCIKGTNRGCIVSTHATDEAEAVCDTLAILVNGCTLSIGSPYLTKGTCSKGLIVDVKMSRDYNLPPANADDEVQHNMETFIRRIRIMCKDITTIDQFGDRACLQIDSHLEQPLKAILNRL